ncbi:MAG: AraC family transcriptional regulator [Ruminococcaceae bacterium]|nr:AraC family transcriptional regulator [Oscillospiraceae bacterium]
MKFIYVQGEQDTISAFSVKNLYFKELSRQKDNEISNKKPHHHTQFEIHIITKKSQSYQIEGREYSVKEGHFLLIPPLVRHQQTNCEPGSEKLALSFDAQGFFNETVLLPLTEDMKRALEFSLEEAKRKKYFSSLLIKNRLSELLVCIYRSCSDNEAPAEAEISHTDTRLESAKKFISDNVKQSLSVEDVASYCRMSTKQLTRLFKEHLDVTPAKFILSQKMASVEKELKLGNKSIKAVSEEYGFSGEYYFNAAFKAHSGMSPGKYRKMYGSHLQD